MLTAEHGKITVMAKGARSPRSKFAASSQPFIFANFEIYRKNDLNWLQNCNGIENFVYLRKDADKLPLASYITDVAYEVTAERIPAREMLRMTLNALYAVNKEKAPPEIIKAVYEMRTAAMNGYLPDVSGCYKCHGYSDEIMYFDIMNGRFVCPECLKKMSSDVPIPKSAYDDTDYERNILVPMGAGAVTAMVYAIKAPSERLFSFKIAKNEDKEAFFRAAELYLLHHLERGFDTLDFYKVMKKTSTT